MHTHKMSRNTAMQSNKLPALLSRETRALVSGGLSHLLFAGIQSIQFVLCRFYVELALRHVGWIKFDLRKTSAMKNRFFHWEAVCFPFLAHTLYIIRLSSDRDPRQSCG